MLRSAFSLGRISAPQRALAFRSYATKSNEGMEDLYRATREGDLEKAEQLANSMTQSRQVLSCLASVNLMNFNFEKAKEYTEQAKNAKN